MRVTFDPSEVCWREYEPFTVLYDLRNRQLLTLENVAADIWHKIAYDCGCDLDAIARYISIEYDCDPIDIADDVREFVEELHQAGVVLLDGTRKEAEVTPRAVVIPEEDVEGDVIRSLEPFDQIYSATFEMTYACNESCVHCYAHYPGLVLPPRQLPFEVYRRTIDELAKLGCMHIALTGGDPFMHRDFPEVFFYARKRGFVCDVYTNGLSLYDNQQMLERMAAAQPRAFFISLYGSCPEVHDLVTCVPGSFVKTLHVVRRLRGLDVPVVLNVMLLSINHHDLPNIVRLAKELEAEYRVNMSLIMRNDGSDRPMRYFVGDRTAIKEAISTVRDNFFSIDVTASGFVRTEYMCGAGVTSISIDPEGQIHPCISLKNVLGDVVTGTVREAWDGHERKRVMDSMRWENTRECMACASRDWCPHCPGMSQAENGDVFACNACDRIISECIMELDT